MKTKLLISSVVIVIIGVVVIFGFNEFDNSLNEKESLTLLTKTITRDALYDSFTTSQCLSFSTNEITKESFIISVYEIHDNDCKGDPNTQPRVDTFKVMRQTKNIFHYDVREDSYFPYDSSKLKR